MLDEPAKYPIGHGARLCYNCHVIVDADLEKMLPAWYTAEGPVADFVKPALPPAISTEPMPHRGQLACENPRMNAVVTSGPKRKPLVPECQHCGVEIVYGQMSCIACEFNGPQRRRVRPKPQMER